jgi:hypothetical protein
MRRRLFLILVLMGGCGSTSGSSGPGTGGIGGGAAGAVGGAAADRGGETAGAAGNPNAAGAGGGGQPGAAGAGGQAALPIETRTAAVEATVADNAACTSLTAFYWEVGDRDGAKASGQGGDLSGGPVDPAASMVIASASKFIFGAYALEKHTLDEIVAEGWDAYLNFTSGYDNMSDASCDLATTVSACFTAGSNDTRTDADVGKFYYNGGHLQAYAVDVAGLGDDHRVGLTPPFLSDDVEAAVGKIGLTYAVPQLAGGGAISPAGYGLFLRRILSGTLRIHDVLGARAVCAWTNHPDECDALYSPVNQTRAGGPNDVSDYKWHYSLAHWVEDDGTFSSPGLFGFYPWIDASKTWYGLVARHDTAVTKTPRPAFASVVCGRLIRAAWLSGQEQR